jgi:hypothetical protein
MKDVRILAAVLAVGLAAAVRADVAPDKKSTLTITTPVEVPGAVLDPGTYVVKLVDTQSNRNIVAFTSADERRVFATAIATPHVAADDSHRSTFVFYAVPEGSTKVLRTWFASNDRYGQDFVYPAERASALRQTTNAEVPAMTAEQSREIADRMKPAAVVSDNEPLRTTAAPAADSEQAAPASMTADATTALPKTASRTPLLLAAGLLALGVASALRFSGRA